MSTTTHRKDSAATPAHGWLTAAERQRPSRFREITAATPLPAEAAAVRQPHGVRWGQGPLLDPITLQSGTDPRDLRRRRRS